MPLLIQHKSREPHGVEMALQQSGPPPSKANEGSLRVDMCISTSNFTSDSPAFIGRVPFTISPEDENASSNPSSASSENGSTGSSYSSLYSLEDTITSPEYRKEFLEDAIAAGLSEDPGFKHAFMMLENGLVKPTLFAPVMPGVWRSGFPKPENVPFLHTLGLKTILTLVETDCSESYQQLIKEVGINHIRLCINPNKANFDSIAPVDNANQVQALEQIFDTASHPILIHCNKGKHRTGTLVACLRKLMGWDRPAIINEYRHYAGAKFRELDEKFLDLFDVSSLRLEAAKHTMATASPLLEESQRNPDQIMTVRFPEDCDVPQRKKNEWRGSVRQGG